MSVFVCLFKGFPGQHSLWIKGVGKLVQIYCLCQLCQIWQAQMVSLQMAGRYLGVSILCNKHRVVHLSWVFIYIKKCPSTFTDDCDVHILSVTFPGSQLRGENWPDFGFRWREGHEEPRCWTSCLSKWILQSSLSSFFTFLFFWSLIKGTTHFLNPCLYFCRVRKSGQLLFMAEIFTMWSELFGDHQFSFHLSLELQ